MSGPDVVAIGGGHGLAMSLRAIRMYAARLTAVVATGDDGGSSGRLRSEIAMPAPGDLRRCLTTMSADRRLAEALEYRFTEGELAGHAPGNLLLAALVEQGLDLAAAADLVGGWLGLDPAIVRIVPATSEPIDLVAETAEGVVHGQVAIEAAAELHRLEVVPSDPEVPEAAVDAIAAADQIVLGPGSLYTSVLASAVIPGIRTALAETEATVVYVCNLQATEKVVAGFDVAAHVGVLVDHGIRPHAVVAQTGALPIGRLPDGDIAVVEADIDRPHGLAHDAGRLGLVLAGIVDRP